MRGLIERIGRALTEATMGFLALAAVALGAAPMAFAPGPTAESALAAAQWAIVGIFALEYVVDLILAPSKRAYVLGGWRLLDLAIIATPVAGALLGGGPAFGASPALRLLRVLTIVGLGARIGSRAAAAPEAGAGLPVSCPETAELLGDGAPARAVSPDELRASAGAAGTWCHGASLREDRADGVAAALGLDAELVRDTLAASEYPRIEEFERASAFFLWLPAFDEATATVKRNGLLVLAPEAGLVSLARAPDDIVARVEARLARTPTSPPFASRVLLALLDEVLHRYERVGGCFERRLRELEGAPVRENRREFLEEGFRMQRQLAFVKSDLWRLRGILSAIAEDRLRCRALGPGALDRLRVLADEAGYVYETVFNTREGLLSLIDLHLSVSSFEMNQVMRTLAVATALGLVPAVAGGLLGMNLAGNPWPFTLGEVTYVVLAAMAGALYVFSVKGWLR